MYRRSAAKLIIPSPPPLALSSGIYLFKSGICFEVWEV